MKSRLQPQEVLVGGAVLARHLGRQRPARPGHGVKLNPFRVDVQFHADPRAMAGQRLGEVLGAGRHAPGVEQVAGGVLAERAACDVLATAERRTPRVPVGGRRR